MKKLLIADDIEMNRKVIERFFKKDFEVYTAENGKIALELLEHKEIDVLILDIVMPEMDGLEVLEQLSGKKRWKNMAILVATSVKEKTERMALSLGADDVVSKPYDPMVIKKRLENVLGKKQLEKVDEKKNRKKLIDLYDKIEKNLSFIQENIDDAGEVNHYTDVIRNCVEKARGFFN